MSLTCGLIGGSPEPDGVVLAGHDHLVSEGGLNRCLAQSCRPSSLSRAGMTVGVAIGQADDDWVRRTPAGYRSGSSDARAAVAPRRCVAAHQVSPYQRASHRTLT